MSKPRKVPGVHDNPVAGATRKALERIDAFIQGATLNPPEAKYLDACDELLRTRSPSIYTGVLFFMYYWLEDPRWDLNGIPVGWRNQHHGDKYLCEELTKRHIRLHERIKAYGENVGSKGGQANFRPMTDDRYGPFLKTVANAPAAQRTKIADYLAQRFAESRWVSTPLPPVGAGVLTFVRAKTLFHGLIDTPSAGRIQQLLIAALLFVYRRRSGVEVMTHQIHAADKSDKVAGDIEEYHNGELLRAYEVTVRPEWKARMSGFRHKMDLFRLSKYVIIAGNVNDDAEWAEPARLAMKIEPYGRDIAVVDILDVVNFFAAELTPAELEDVVNKGYDYLTNIQLCGRPEVIERYWQVVRNWLTAPSATPGGPGHGT